MADQAEPRSPKKGKRENEAWYALFCFSSVAMQLLNKGIALALRSTALDGLLMIWQNGCAVVLGLAFVVAGPYLPERTKVTFAMRPIRQHQVRRLFLPSVNFVLMLMCSLRALRFVHIATVVVARNVATCFIAAAEKVVFGRPVGFRPLVAMLLTIVGSLIYAYNDLHYHQVGYFWQAMNTGLFVLGQIYEKWAMSKTHDQTPLGVSMIKNLWSLPISVGVMLCSQDDLSSIGAALGELQANLTGTVLVLLSGIGCFGMSVCYMTLYSISSATSITVAANLNKVLTIVVAQFIFGSSLGSHQVVGLSICLIASAWYSMEQCRPKPAVPGAQANATSSSGQTQATAVSADTGSGLRRR